ncbi:hypothetical protein FRUB_08711 [Fimbriiglobus ruber]|uniref:Cytochrome c domain-containing protein n=1 Tax=Fimbriiglobus ruber TaxID=1908690 RepID=A0A225DC88_9BACT|nr:hypothetical protein FRUB_08711 [Fimbriiglobus ruber]
MALAVAALVGAPAPAAEKLQFNRDVRQILAENCFACHGPDSAARKAKLRLDVREQAIEAEAIAPGKPDKSAAVARIFLADDDKELMPPAKSHKKLTAAQKDVLKRWVTEGAEYQLHWSFIAPKRPAVPVVKNAGWVKNPIDAFVLAELEKRGLTSAPEADRRTLARRLSLDLTGLPPKPEEVEAFVADKAPDAYERYVARLMDTPQWGEHRGRAWLDVARYADTHGIHFDNYRENWAYREWVIRAFNENKPFDQFTIEQLAGDLLPNPSLDQLVATGFNRCNITTNEGGAISEEYLVLYNRDRTETVNQTWMGLTAGCAVCHDHKFDPLSAREFYSMAAFFNNSTQGAMDGNISNTPPVVTVPRLNDRDKWTKISKDVAAAAAKVEARRAAARADFTRWLATAKADEFAGKIPTDGLVFHAPLTEGKGKEFKVSVGGKDQTLKYDSGYDWTTDRAGKKTLTVRSGPAVELKDVGDFDKAQAFSVSAWVHINKRGMNGALLGRMDEDNKYRGWDLWMQADRVGMHIINTWQEDALKVVAKTPLKTATWYHVTATYDGSGKAAGVKIYINGEPQQVDVEADALKSTTRTTVPFKFGQRSGQASRTIGAALQDVRIYSRGLTGIDAQQLAGSSRTVELLAKPADKRTPKETDELFSWWLATNDEQFKALDLAHKQLVQEESTIKARGTVAYVWVEKPSPPEAYVLYRGDYDKRRDKVAPGTPKVLPAYSADLPKNRLGFAKWLLQPDHPLTTRVTVNRYWQEVFGTGLVKTSGDFGITGDQPTHPELLDWLAVEFREGGWDVKKFFKLIVTSNAYKQSAQVTPEKLEKDPHNRYLSRGARFRMDAEMIRDYALAASGILVEKLGGPSVRPYQPEGVWEAVAMIGSNTRDYRRDTGENLYRRSMYTFWKRAAPPASMEIFNAPNRETCAVRRDRTNTPLQALVTLNDVQFVEAARHLAQLGLTTGGSTFEGRLNVLSKRLLARSLRPEEQAIVKQIHDDLLAHYKAKPAEAQKLVTVGESKPDPKLDVADLAAWTMVANELLNLDEVLCK